VRATPQDLMIADAEDGEEGNAGSGRGGGRGQRGAPRLGALSSTADIINFPRTGVNLCMFQQESVFLNWWVPVEQRWRLGFSARILFSFAQRAIVQETVGRGPSRPVAALLKHCWGHGCQTYGHDVTPPAAAISFTQAGQASFKQLYHDVASIEAESGWGTAMKALLGKLEYHVPALGFLNHVVEQVCYMVNRGSFF
jgi:hypothetical protein